MITKGVNLTVEEWVTVGNSLAEAISARQNAVLKFNTALRTGSCNEVQQRKYPKYAKRAEQEIQAISEVLEKILNATFPEDV